MLSKSTRGLTLLVAALTLSACGGSNSKVDPEDTPQNFAISGTVSGLTGDVSLNWLARSEQLAANGSFQFTDAAVEGANVELTLSDIPDSQDCAITSSTSFDDISANISDITIVCSNKTALKVTLSNYFTGEQLQAASVSAVWASNTDSATSNAQTDENGEAIIYVTPIDGRVTLNARAAGFGAQSRSVELTTTTAEVESTLQLQPVNGTVNFSADTGGDLEIESVDVVTVAANAFVDAAGNIYSGLIDSEITLIDPTRDPALMPGGYQTRSTMSGDIAQIESFGAINVEFFDAEGNELNLADGQTATIRIPVAAVNSTPPATIPLYYYDEESGFWVEEGEAALVEHDGTLVYEGTVAHFTVWNADRVYETVYIQGCVEDALGEAVVGASVSTRGFDYIGTASAVSNELGIFSVPVKMNSTAFLSAINGVQSRTLTLNIAEVDIVQAECLVVDVASSTITLSWGANPSDLDSHFHGQPDDADIDSFHVYFSSHEASVGESFIYLDVDDTTSYGPEVVSVSSFSEPGTYRYAVDHYSGSSDIAASPARVELNLNGVETVYSPPAGNATECWAVFDIVVTENGDASAVPINTWESESYCDDAFGSGSIVDGGDDDLQSAQKTLNPNVQVQKRESVLQQSISKKYYAK